MNRIGSRIYAIAAALSLVAICGCGRTPTSPLLDSMEDASTPAAAKAPASPSGLQPPYYGPDPSQPERAESSVMVNGGRGATLQVGNMTVRIPKHAFSGRAMVSVNVPDPTKLHVQLSITPSWKNRFNIPVTLEFDGAACGEDVRLMSVEEFDAPTSEWVAIASTPDHPSGKLRAQLGHFSEYRATCELKRKSGW